MKENKKIIIVFSVIGAFLLLVLILSVSSSGLSDLESKIYEATKNELSSFKDPSSVKLQEVQICGDYAKVSIDANNSFGASVSSSYVMYIGKKLTPEGKVIDDYYWLRDGNLKSSNVSNTSQVRILNLKKFELEVSKECVDTMFDETSIILSQKVKLILSIKNCQNNPSSQR